MKESRVMRGELVVLLCVLLTACSPRLLQSDVTPVNTFPPPSPTPTLPVNQTQTEANAQDNARERDDGYVHITPSELALMLEDKDFLLINTHAPYGFEIEQTDAHIPLDQDGQWLHHYPADKTAKIVLYCRSANWSVITAEKLVAAGYSNVWHLDGGMAAWHADGLPLMTQ